MPTSYVKLPVGMTASNGRKVVKCYGATVGEVIDEAIALEPRMRARIFREDGRIFACVFLNGRNVNTLGGRDAPLADGDKLMIVPPMSGG